MKRIYFIGIGGIGMSGLARHFHAMNAEVFGYDRVSTTLTKQMEAEGIQINYEDQIENIPKHIDLVVYTPAIQKNHQQLSYFLDNNFEVKKRSEVLEALTADKFTIAVAGSHGKTTVTTMIAHVLKHSGVDCTAFMGGIAVNYNSNYLHGNSDIMVVEADEFDRSFLRLQPDIAVITAVDTDHLDIYGNKAGIEEAFLQFVGKVKPEGCMIVNSRVELLEEIGDKQLQTYNLTDPTADFYVSDLAVEHGVYNFLVIGKGEYRFTLGMGGRHNIENALAAFVVARQLKIEAEDFGKALGSFKGVKRRFEYIINTDDLVFIDDYAHHPKELSALIESVRELYPGKKITAVFQPHLFSRTKDLASEFAQALDLADEVVLLDIYPAREEPLPGVTSTLILDQITRKEKVLISREELVDYLSQRELEVLLTIGAGDIDKEVDKIKQQLIKTAKNEH